MRLDVYLFQKGYAPSRSKARELIENGAVSVNGACVKKCACEVEDTAQITLTGEVLPYVSRGGLKLQAALDAFQIDVAGVTAVDLGASTGGFTDCLLKRGAKKVYAVDCGTDQLHPSLRCDGRVVVKEKCNARYLTEADLGERCDLAVMDVSFISQALLYDTVCHLLKENGCLISLIKPQFEAGKKALSKKGIVTEEKTRLRVIEDLRTQAALYQLKMENVIVSPIQGGDGNVEYLAIFRYWKPETEETK